MNDLITIIVSVLLIVGGLLWRRSTVNKIAAAEQLTKKLKRNRRFGTWAVVLGAYILVTRLIVMVFGKGEAKSIEVAIVAERTTFLGMNISTTVLTSWVIIAVLVVLALILRITVLPRLKDVPSGAQNVLEMAIESAMKYTKTTAHHMGEFLASYIFTIVAFLIGCAFAELCGVRTPASDIMVTAAMAIITFFFINFYGIKVKGLGGRLKAMASPTPVVFPIKIITDLAIPVSLACRLFGNMLGGLVVMDMLYNVMGAYAIGIPSVLGLFFNVFHPLMQAFVFITLTLNFINEATE
jgi:F-type H+-transporting ATPase subunit a